MQRRWIDFEEGPDSLEKDDIYVTVNKQGELLINRIGYDALGKPEWVKLKFDKYHRAIGLERVPRDTPGAFPVKAKGRCGHHVIRAKPLCRRWEIEIPHTVRFLEPEFDEGILVLSLKKLKNARRGRRPRH